MHLDFEFPPAFAITYANDRHMDGAGAQLQRIYGIYAIAKFLNVPYIHSGLRKVGYQGLTALEANRGGDIHSEYNRLFKIPSDLELPEDRVVHEIGDASLERIRTVVETAKLSGTFHLLRIVYPYGITDCYPEAYRCVKAISPFNRTESDVFRIAIHVRRGEQLALSSARLLPNAYFIAAAKSLITALESRKLNFTCELHTEVASKTFIVTPQHHGICGRIRGDVAVTPEMNAIHEFDVLPNVVKRINLDAIETLRGMATADALIMSRSSFSYVAALLNSAGMVVYYPFWHSPMKEWLRWSDEGLLSPDAVEDHLDSWAARQSRCKRAH